MLKLERLIEYGFYLFIFLLPWQTRLIFRDSFLNGFVWEYGRFSLYGTEILIGSILLLYLVWLIKNKKISKTKFSDVVTKLKNPANFIYGLAVLFLFWSGVSLVFSLDAKLAYFSWLKMLEAAAVFSMVLVFGFKIKKVAIAWVASAVVQGTFATWQFFSQFVFANKWLGLAEHLSTVGGSIILQTSDERWLRAYGSLPHPNILAGFLLVGLLFLLYLAFYADTLKQRIFILAGLIFTVPGLFFSFSRSAWVAMVLSITILAFWLWRRQHQHWQKVFFKLLLLVVLMLSILGTIFSSLVATRILGQEEIEVKSIDLRFTFTQQALELIKNSPLTGVGIGNYTLGVFEQVNNSWPGYYYQPVHNIFLLILAELGILGIVLFCAMLFLTIYHNAKRAASLEKTIVMLTLFSVLIISLFDHYFWTLYFGVIIFWITLAFNLRQLKN